MSVEKTNDKFIKFIPSKEKDWINDIYYGTKGISQKGHLVSSGSLVVESAIVMKDTLTNVVCEQPLYHRNAKGDILLDTKLFDNPQQFSLLNLLTLFYLFFFTEIFKY